MLLLLRPYRTLFVVSTDDGSGVDSAVLVASWTLTDSATGTEPPEGLAAALSGTDSGTGGDSGSSSSLDPDLIDGGLDISYSTDEVTDRQIHFFDAATGTELEPVIVYLVHILSDVDAGQGTELQFVEKVPRRRTALSHLGGVSDEGSITYPKPGV